MARIKIIIPDNTITSIEIPVRITDINYGNHVGNDSLISILHEARVKWLNQLGYFELDIEGSSIIMNELGVNYLNESFYVDVLNIQLSVGEISTAVTLYSGQFVAQSEISVVITFAPDSGK